jgi:hypothetical protein
VKGLLKYIAYGRHADRLGQEARQRGVWLDHNGQKQPHEAVRQWAKEKVHRHGYDHTYQLLLSTRDGGLSEADFNQALRQGSEISQVREWRMMVHDDTDHQHAHAILFSREKLPKAHYKEWQKVMQAELAQLQGMRLRETQLEAAHELQTAEKAQSQGWELTDE